MLLLLHRGCCGVFFDELAEDSNSVVFVVIKIEAISSSLSQLAQIVVQTLFADAHLLGCLFQTHALLLMVFVHVAVVQFAPLGDLFNDVADGSLLGPFEILGFFLGGGLSPGPVAGVLAAVHLVELFVLCFVIACLVF